jgi:hypothetical protein
MLKEIRALIIILIIVLIVFIDMCNQYQAQKESERHRVDTVRVKQI